MLSRDNMATLMGDTFSNVNDSHGKHTPAISGSSNLGNNNLYLLVRIAPSTKQFSLPFSRATSWDRLIASLYQIYENNNISTSKCTLHQAYSSIRVTCDESGGRVFAEFWAELLRPAWQIVVEFTHPFAAPPWNSPKIPSGLSSSDTLKKEEEEEDIEMSSFIGTETIEIGTEPLIISDIGKTDEYDMAIQNAKIDKTSADMISSVTPASIPASPMSVTPLTSLDSEMESIGGIWSNTTSNSMKPEMGGTYQTLTSVVAAIPMASNQVPITITRKLGGSLKSGLAISSTDVSSIQRLSSSNSTIQVVKSQAQLPTRQATTQSKTPTTLFPPSVPAIHHHAAFVGSPQTPPPSPFILSTTTYQEDPTKTSQESSASAPPAKRKRKASSMVPNSNNDNESVRNTRGASHDPPSQYSSRREPPSSTREKTTNVVTQSINIPSQAAHVNMDGKDKCTVLVQNALLLDAISAGEYVKIVRTKQGEIIAMRQEEEVEAVMRKRSSTNIEEAKEAEQKYELEQAKSRASRKRAHDDDMDALIRIWSGGGVPPSKKVKQIHVFDKLTPEDKIELQKLVREHHIIRIDHFTAPFIQAWKCDILPNADETQCNEYITDVASTVYNTEAKRQTAYRLFLEANEYSPKRDKTSKN